MSEITAHCKRCGTHFNMGPDGLPNDFCGECSQTILGKIARMTPKPPDAITWERGVEILNVVQRELYGPML